MAEPGEVGGAMSRRLWLFCCSLSLQKNFNRESKNGTAPLPAIRPCSPRASRAATLEQSVCRAQIFLRPCVPAAWSKSGKSGRKKVKKDFEL